MELVEQTDYKNNPLNIASNYIDDASALYRRFENIVKDLNKLKHTFPVRVNTEGKVFQVDVDYSNTVKTLLLYSINDINKQPNLFDKWRKEAEKKVRDKRNNGQLVESFEWAKLLKEKVYQKHAHINKINISLNEVRAARHRVVLDKIEPFIKSIYKESYDQEMFTEYLSQLLYTYFNHKEFELDFTFDMWLESDKSIPEYLY